MPCHRTRSHFHSIVSRAVVVLLAAAGLVLVETSSPAGASSSDFAITRLTDVGFVQADNTSADAVISDDGSTVAFASMASNLVSPPPGGVQQVFAWDRSTGLIELVSVADDGTPATGFNHQPRVSADGRYVIFISDAANLVADDTNGRGDVFVRDRVAGSTVRITADDAPYTFYNSPQLSDDGATAVVQAGAPGAGDLLEGEWQTGPLTVVPDVPTNGERAFALSGDATTIAMAYQDAGTRVGFYDRATDAIIDDIAEGDATQLTISDDASTIAYVVGQPFELQQVHLLQRGGAALTVDDRSFDPEELRHPWLSGDGSTLVYSTYLESCDTGFGGDCTYSGSVFDFDVATQSMRIVSRPCDGCFESGNSDGASTDETGEWIAFDSTSFDLIGADDLNDVADVFLAQRIGNAAPVFSPGSAITAPTVGATVVEVEWDTATDDVAVTGYDVFLNGSLRTTTDSATTTTTLSGLSPDTAYVIGVEAMDAGGQRSERLTVNVRTEVDLGGGTAALLVDGVTATTVDLTWDPADPSGLTGYRVLRSTSGGPLEPVGDVDAATTSYTDEGLSPVTDYSYQVVRLEGAAGAAHSVEVGLTTPPVTVDGVTLNVPFVPGIDVAVLGETMSIEVAAAPDLDGEAVVTFHSWFSEAGVELGAPAERTATIPIVSSSFLLPGNYRGEFELVEGVTEIVDVEVTMTHATASADSATAPEPPFEVSGGLDVTVDAAPDAYGFGSGNEWTLRASGTVKPTVDVPVAGGGTTRFSGFLDEETATIQLITWWGRVETDLSGIAVTQGRFAEVAIVPRDVGSVVFEVTDVDDAPVNGATVDIFDDATGEQIGTRATGGGGPGRSEPAFEEVLAGDSVRLELSGPTIDSQTVITTIVAGEQTVSFTSIETLRGTVTGAVLNDDGTPTDGANMSITQNGVRRDFVTEFGGTFEIDAAPGVASIAAGRVIQTIIVPEPPEVATVELRLRGTREYLLDLDVYIVDPDGTASGPDIQLNDPDLRLEYGGGSQPARPTQIVTGPRGETVDFCLFSYRRGLGRECATVTLGEEPNVTAEFHFEPAAVVTGDLADRSASVLTSVGWAAFARRTPNGPGVSYVSGITGRQDFRLYLPEPGDWFVTVSWNDPSNPRNPFVAELPITVSDGQALDLGTILPTDEGRFSAAGNGAVVSPETALAGETVAVRVAYANDMADTTNARVLVPVPAGTTLLPGGTVIDGVPAPTSFDAEGNAIVDLGDLSPGERGVIHLRLRLDDASIDDASIAVRIVHDESTGFGDLVGIATLSPVRVTLFGPARSATGAVPLQGRAPIGSTVTIIDAGREIGQAETTAGGQWEALVSLDDLGGSLSHELIATTTVDATTVRSLPIQVDIDPAWPEPFRATLQQEGRTASWDPRAGVASFPFIYHIPNSPISSGGQLVYAGNPITVDVEFDDPGQIRWLVVTVGDTTERATLVDGVWHAELAPFELGAVSFSYDAIRTPITRDELVVPDEQTLHERIPITNGLQVISVNSGESGGRVQMELPVGDDTGLIATEIDVEAGVDFTPTGEQLDLAARAGVPAYVDTFDVDVAPDGDTASVGVEVYVLTEFLADSTTQEILDALLTTAIIGGAVGVHTKLTINVDVDGVGVLGSAAGALSVIDALRTGEKYDMLDTLRQIAEKCLDTLTTAQFNEFNDLITELVADAAFIDGLSAGANIASFALGVANPLLGVATSLATGAVGTLLSSNLESNALNIKQRMTGLGCASPDAPSAQPRWIYDPAGYVYEGVESNRIEGVTATLFEGATETGPFVEWDAEPFAQQNPLRTDDDGAYAWDVPEGWWQVRWTSDDYLPAESEVLRVLPPHFDVNVGLVPVEGPSVVDAAATSGPSGIDVTFSTYMDPSTVDITAAGLGGTVVPVDPEDDPDGRTLAQTFRLVPDRSLVVGETLAVAVGAAAEDFAGRVMGTTSQFDLLVEAAVSGTLEGVVFDDADLSTFHGATEAGIGGVAIDVTDSYGATQRVTTDADGHFAATLPVGPATVSIVAGSPALAALGLTSGNLTQTVLVVGTGSTATAVGFAPMKAPLSPLQVSVAEPVTVPEGSQATLDVTVTGGSAPVAVGIDLDGDGQADTPSGSPPVFDAAALDGPDTVDVDVVATDGLRSGSTTVSVQVTNIAPTVAAADVEQADPDEPLTLAMFTDPGIDDTHTATVDWGDGSLDGPFAATGGQVDAVHGYAEAGVYTVTVCVTDDDGGTNCADGTVNAAPVDDDICTVTGTEGPDFLVGTSGDDVICGLGGNDVIHGSGGDDVIQAGDGDDLVLAGPGDDQVDAGAGNDIVLAGSGRDEVDGGEGRDVLWGESSADVLRGGNGSDLLVGGSGDDELYGEAGRDLLWGGLGRDLLDGGPEQDSCFGSRWIDRLVAC